MTNRTFLKQNYLQFTYLPRLEAAAATSMDREPRRCWTWAVVTGGAGTDSHMAPRRMLLLLVSFFGHLWVYGKRFLPKRQARGVNGEEKGVNDWI